jgi:putative tricarboxylic transport membrane protein
MSDIQRSSRLLNGNVVGGAALIVASAAALFSAGGLDTGTLSDIGPALFPRALATLLLILGAAILVSGLGRQSNSEGLQPWKLRPIICILGGILLFGLTVRSIGIVFAAPLALLTAGFATAETKWGQLLVFVVALTIFCSVLFRIVLGLPIPLAPWILGY